MTVYTTEFASYSTAAAQLMITTNKAIPPDVTKAVVARIVEVGEPPQGMLLHVKLEGEWSKLPGGQQKTWLSVRPIPFVK